MTHCGEIEPKGGEAGVRGAQVASAIIATYKGMSRIISHTKDNGNQAFTGSEKGFKIRKERRLRPAVL